MIDIHPDLIARLAKRRILVVGDLLLDEYLIGRVRRLSREAPVPVLEQTRRRYLPGGAANPAANIRSLGSQAVVVGLLGRDETAELLRAALAALGIDMAGIVVDAERPTTRKTRIVAEGSYVFAHHLARVDHVSREPVQGDRERHLCDRIASLMPGCDAVLVSDYRSGAVTPAVVRTIRDAARRHDALSVVDSQGDLGQFRGFDLVRCNRQEAERYLGEPLHSDADFDQALGRLLAELEVGGMVISRGSEGLSLLDRGLEPQHLASTNRSQVFDVTGAGDTLTAVIALALAAGLDLRTAAQLGNLAAGIAVQRLGNVAVTAKELAAAHPPSSD